jgi:predicted nucleic acid-binding protein
VISLFADSFYWVALTLPTDSARSRAVAFSQELRGATLVTTHEVLAEVLAFFSGGGIHSRRIAVQAVRETLEDPSVLVVPQSQATFATGLQLYAERLDKGYSHTDCVSMATMRKLKITDVLTNDHHFRQEGFRILF